MIDRSKLEQTATQYQKAYRIFQDTRTLGLTRRADEVKKLSDGDQQLEQCVQRIFHASDMATPGLSHVEGLSKESIPLVSLVRFVNDVPGHSIQGVLGEGGMGVVFRATQDRLNREVALKLVHPQCLSEDSLKRFDDEIRALAQLRHPGIAQIFDAGSAHTALGAVPYFTMELVDGDPLPLVRAQLTPAQKLQILIDIADALCAAHQKGIIHRDLKPTNILIDSRLHVKLVDFGICSRLGTKKAPFELGLEPSGTLPYLSPEQLKRGDVIVDARLDVYGLGVVGIELFGGELPKPPKPQCDSSHTFSGLDALEEWTQAESKPQKLLQSPQRDLQWVLAKATARRAENRYSSMERFCDDLRRCQDGRLVSARPYSPFHRSIRHLLQHKARAIAGFVFVLLTLSAMWITHVRSLDKMAQSASLRSNMKLAAALSGLENNKAYGIRVQGLFDELIDTADRLTQESRTDETRLAQATIHVYHGRYLDHIGENSIASFTQAEALLQELDSEFETNIDAGRLFAECLIKKGQLREDHGKTERAYSKAQALLEALRRIAPTNTRIDDDLGHLHIIRGFEAFEAKHYSEALAHGAHAVDVFESLVEHHGGDSLHRFGLSEAMRLRAFVEHAINDPHAEASAISSLAIIESLPVEPGFEDKFRRQRIACLLQLSRIHESKGQLAMAARSSLRAGHELWQLPPANELDHRWIWRAISHCLPAMALGLPRLSVEIRQYFKSVYEWAPTHSPTIFTESRLRQIYTHIDAPESHVTRIEKTGEATWECSTSEGLE